MYLHCNAQFTEYASTTFGHTNKFGCVQILFFSSCSAMMHLNYRTGIAAPLVTLRVDRTSCLYGIKYWRSFLREMCDI